ncbi:hypothetical protein ACHHYP_00463 [Achlya hypogyna]|uniref:BAH domain-containing protein n=1 Tax=Achlya hypogyna TaxID=1202772 RepID=A0A1V9ZAN8_ACHHY|nr:hypothetical protein ACHHYP_00463 [Achlya hypogyna]
MDESTGTRRRLPREARNVANYAYDSPAYLDTVDRRSKRSKPNVVDRPAAGRRRASSDSDTSEDDDKKIAVGDCVIVDSSMDYDYIALVCGLQYSTQDPEKAVTFIGQWFYRPEDIAASVLEKMGTPVLHNEVFLSTQKDRNSLENVREKCKIVSALDYQDRLNVIRQGHELDTDDDERTFICRFRYNPENRVRPFKALKEGEIRFSSVGEANVGDEFQVGALPPVDPGLRERYLAECADRPHPRAEHIWSPATMEAHAFLFKKYLSMVDIVRFGVGNVVKTYRKACASCAVAAHVRGVVFAYNDDDSVGLCTSDGVNLVRAKKSDLTSVLTDDRVMHHFHAAKCNVTQAIHACTAEYMALQTTERQLFRREVELNCNFSKVSLS